MKERRGEEKLRTGQEQKTDMDVEDEKRPVVAVMQHFGCRLPLNFMAEEEENLLGEGRGLDCMTGLPQFCPISCLVCRNRMQLGLLLPVL